MKTAYGFLAATAVVGLLAAAATAHAFIVPIRPDIRVRGEWQINYHHVSINVRDQVASVAVDQEFENIGRGMIEVEYFFPVPPDAAVDSLTLVVNGKEFAAKLYKADEARRIYQDIVRQKKDPALLEYVGFGLYKTSAFPLEHGKPAKVLVTYKTIAKKDRNVVEVWYPLNTEKFSAKPIEEVSIKVDIKSKADITSVYSPAHDIRKDQPDPRHVIVTYRDKRILPTTDFQLFYKEADEEVGATLITHQPESRRDGYFMVLASPNIRSAKAKAVPKDLVLVLDHSGSMSGEKIDQAKAALKHVLGNLNDDDRFNVILYSDRAEGVFDGLVTADRRSIDKALDRVDRLEATGGTNIHEAVQKAMESVEMPRRDADRPAYVMFLTDGRPTVGTTAEDSILKAAEKANVRKARVFAFGVGYDVNVRLLDKLAQANAGRTEYVKPKEDIEVKISAFYNKIKNPVMTNLKLDIRGLKLRDVYPRELPDLFEGDQIVVVGRYEIAGAVSDVFKTELVITGTYQGRERGFEYTVEVERTGRRGGYDFVEKLWAVRRVGYLLDQIQLHGENKEVIDELIRLSKEYGIMTPYTAFLADERTDLSRPMELRRRAEESMRELTQVEGDVGQRGAANRAAMKESSNLSVSAGIRGDQYADLAKAASGPGGQPAPAAVPPAGVGQWGYSSRGSYEDEKAEAVANVRNVGNQALYQRGNRWVTPDTAKLDVSRDKDKIQVVERFSDEYFALVAKNTAQENAVLATQGPSEELLIELRGQAYLIK